MGVQLLLLLKKVIIFSHFISKFVSSYSPDLHFVNPVSLW